MAADQTSGEGHAGEKRSIAVKTSSIVTLEMEKAAETETSWAPLTPGKTILPKPTPICGDIQETEATSDSEEFPPGFVHGAQAGTTKIRDLADRRETGTGLEHHHHGSFSSGAADVIWAAPAIPGTPGAVQGTFTNLLALADAAIVPNGSFLCLSDSYFWKAPTGDGPWTGGNYTAPNTRKFGGFFEISY